MDKNIPGKEIQAAPKKKRKASRRKWNLSSMHDLNLSAQRLIRLFDEAKISGEDSKVIAMLIRLSMELYKAEAQDDQSLRIARIEEVLNINQGLKILKQRSGFRESH